MFFSAALPVLPPRRAFLQECSYSLLRVIGLHQLVEIYAFGARQALVKVYGVPSINRFFGQGQSCGAEPAQTIKHLIKVSIETFGIDALGDKSDCVRVRARDRFARENQFDRSLGRNQRGKRSNRVGTIENTSIEAWEKMLNINLKAVFLLMQKALPTIIQRRGK